MFGGFFEFRRTIEDRSPEDLKIIENSGFRLCFTSLIFHAGFSACFALIPAGIDTDRRKERRYLNINPVFLPSKEKPFWMASC
jgi:hypothetical protein